MIIKKASVFILSLILLIFSVCSCGIVTWNGFYNENLTKYLSLGQYRELSYTAYETSVSQDEINSAAQSVIEANSSLVRVDRKIQAGDTVTFDRFCFINSVSMPDLSEENGTYVVGKEYDNAVIKQITDNICGLTEGETAEIPVTLPEKYISETSPQTNALYRITVLAVNERIIPELTDDFVRSINSEIKTVDEFLADIKSRLELEKKENAEYKIESELWKKVIDGSALIDTPSVVYNTYFEEIYSTYEEYAKSESVELVDYLASSCNISEGEFKKLVEERTLASVKEVFVLYSIVKNENITYTEQEYTDFADHRAAASEGVFSSGEDYIAYYGNDRVIEMLLKEKVMEIITSTAVVS